MRMSDSKKNRWRLTIAIAERICMKMTSIIKIPRKLEIQH
jgi:hypothetical protein